MKVRRLLLCLLLSVAMTVTFIPSIAFADGTGPDDEISKISLERPDGSFETEIGYSPDLEEGDTLKIWYQGEEYPVAYEYFYDEDEEEGYFVNEDDDEDIIDESDLDWTLDGDWDEYEEGESCSFIVSYGGATCTVEAVIVGEDPDEDGLELVYDDEYYLICFDSIDKDQQDAFLDSFKFK